MLVEAIHRAGCALDCRQKVRTMADQSRPDTRAQYAVRVIAQIDKAAHTAQDESPMPLQFRSSRSIHEGSYRTMWWEWLLGVVLFSFYIICLFTVCRLTFEKGHTILGIVGIFMPFLWLLGAILPAKPGSRFDVAQRNQYQVAAPTPS
jgi:hypothetical protein